MHNRIFFPRLHNAVFDSWFSTLKFDNLPEVMEVGEKLEERLVAYIVRLPAREGKTYTDMRRLTTGIRSEKCVVWPFRRCANVTQCTYTNLDSTV